MGFARRLGALLRLWGESHPDVTIETAFRLRSVTTGETADLTIYRIVQEALTNVFRHAGATSVNVTIEPAEQPTGMHGSRGCARVRISDNGRGIRPDHKLGLGLTGMRERILALGGTLSIASDDRRRNGRGDRTEGRVVQGLCERRRRFGNFSRTFRDTCS